jgi:hypothetical protein
MKEWSETETDSDLFQASLCDFWGRFQVDSQFGKHICRSSATGDRSVAVFGDRMSRGCQY